MSHVLAILALAAVCAVWALLQVVSARHRKPSDRPASCGACHACDAATPPPDCPLPEGDDP